MSLWLMIILAGITTGGPSEEIVDEVARSYVVGQAGGKQARFFAKWTALHEARKWEEGAPAVPLQGHFFDDRRCRWISRLSMTRRLFRVEPDGRLVEWPPGTGSVAVDLSQTVSEQGGGQTSENCNASTPRIMRDFEARRMQLRSAFPAIVVEDEKRLTASLRGNVGAQTVTTLSAGNAGVASFAFQVINGSEKVDAILRKRDGRWDEVQRGRVVFVWDEVETERGYINLVDLTRAMRLSIPVQGGVSRVATSLDGEPQNWNYFTRIE
jgi:hypothetical protein